MSSTGFEKKDAVLTVKPKGRLDTATSPLLESELRQSLDGIQEVIMDFTDVEYISSGGLRVLLATEQMMENRGGCMKLIHVKEHILDLFELVGFMDVVTVESD